MIEFFTLLLMFLGPITIVVAVNTKNFIGLMAGMVALFLSGVLVGFNTFQQEHQQQGAMMYYKGEYKANIIYEIVNDSLVPTDTLIVKCQIH